MRSKIPLFILIATVVAYSFSLFYWPTTLPNRIATHFGSAGHPNGWMTHGQYLALNSFVGFGLPAFVIGICYSIRFFPASTLNVPNASYWRSPDHYPKACQILLDFSCYFASIHLLWTIALNHRLLLANQAHPPFMPPQSILLNPGVYLIAMGIWIARLVIKFSCIRVPVGENQEQI